MFDQKKINPNLNNPNPISNSNLNNNNGIKYNIISNSFTNKNKNNINIGRTQNAQYGAFAQNQITQKI